MIPVSWAGALASGLLARTRDVRDRVELLRYDPPSVSLFTWLKLALFVFVIGVGVILYARWDARRDLLASFRSEQARVVARAVARARAENESLQHELEAIRLANEGALRKLAEMDGRAGKKIAAIAGEGSECKLTPASTSRINRIAQEANR
jgi:hypothetical protein